MSADTLADLHDRLVGKRFHNTSIDESFTIIDVQPPFVLLQYDDGHPWDEACTPDEFAADEAFLLDVTEGGIDAAKYVQLPGGGPTLAAACEDGEHAFSPTPSDMGLDDRDAWIPARDAYHAATRCKRCGLSATTLIEFLDHAAPTICDCCERELLPETDDIVWEPTPEWLDASVCRSCADDLQAAYEAYEVTCYGCEEALGTNEENNLIPATSMLGQRLGVTDTDLASFYLCTDCRSKHIARR